MIIIILQYFLENIIAKMKRWGPHMLLKFVPSDSSIDIAGCQLCQVHCQMRKGGIIKWRIASCLSPLLSYKHKWIWKLASFMTDLMFSLKYIIFDLVYFRRCIAMMNFNSIHVILFSVPPDPVRIYDADGQERMTFVGPYVPGQDLLLTCTAFKG